jgi:hypothetical protein
MLTLVLLAALATPTDPVLAQAMVTSESAEEKVPEDVRHLISADSAGNDGLAFLFVTIAVWMVAQDKSRGWADFAYLIGWELLAALALGAVFGWAMGKLTVWAVGGWGATLSLISATTALAFATVTGLKLLDMDGIFGVFGAGLALSSALGARRSALGARRSALGARRSALGARRGASRPSDRFQPCPCRNLLAAATGPARHDAAVRRLVPDGMAAAVRGGSCAADPAHSDAARDQALATRRTGLGRARCLSGGSARSGSARCFTQRWRCAKPKPTACTRSRPR